MTDWGHVNSQRGNAIMSGARQVIWALDLATSLLVFQSNAQVSEDLMDLIQSYRKLVTHHARSHPGNFKLANFV